jgi:small subunit ribosomal protein S2
VKELETIEESASHLASESDRDGGISRPVIHTNSGAANDAADISGGEPDGSGTSAGSLTRIFPGSRARDLPTVRVTVQPRQPVELSLRTLLSAGVHFGHQTSRWNPAMAPFIHSTRNGIHIINLPKTVSAWVKARRAIVDIAANGGKVLFVGTKKQAQDPIVEEALRCSAFYVSQRWLGGMITNFQTVRKSIERMKKVESTLAEEEQLASTGQPSKFTKKERLMMARELEKLEFSLGGIKEMTGLPDLVFVVDINLEDIAIREARRSNIPVVALVDTNCNPALVDHAIPSNDDGTRAIRLFCAAIADAVMEGQQLYAQRAVNPRSEKKNQSHAAQ